MRMKLLSALLMAGTVAACASNPPPPPPAPEPAPAPAPAPVGPVAGSVFKGMATVDPSSPKSCHAPRGTQTVKIAPNNAFVLSGRKVMIGPDGSLSTAGKTSMVSGTAAANAIIATVKHGKCTYVYTLNPA